MTAGTQSYRSNGRAPRVAGDRPRVDPRMNGASYGMADDAPRRRRLTGREWTRLSAFAIVLVILGAVAGYVTSLVIPKQYAAHAEVLYAISQEQPTGFLREDRNITTQIVLLNSRSVLDPVAEETHISVLELAKRVSAEVVTGSEVITITLTDHQAARAQHLLDLVVKQYLKISNDNPRSELRDYLNSQLTDVQGRISEVRPDASTRSGELAALVEREQWLRTQLDEMQFSDIAGPGATVLVTPYVEVGPVSPKPLISIAAGAFAGLIVAVFAAAFLARRRTRI